MMKAKKQGMKLAGAVLAGALAGVMPGASAVAQEAPASLPNVVIILADDLGYGDLGCYNSDSKVPTPNLDRLAEQGMRFTNAYTPDAVCSPSRLALLTGRYALRSRQQHGVLANWEPPAIEAGRLTLPGLFKQAGYTTAGFSKWHLGATYHTTDGRKPVGQGKFSAERNGANLDLKAGIKGGPADLGFDHWFGFVSASESLVFDQSTPVARIDVYDPPAAAGVEELPVIKLADYLPLMTDKTVAFIREQAPAAREGRPFFVSLFAYVPHVPLAVADDFKGKTKGGDYGDYVHELDHYVGQVLTELEASGLSDNTLVLFASDNGSQFDRTGQGHRPNGQLRGGKYYIYEGGIRTPLIVRWPGRVPAGSTSDQIVSLVDVMATAAEITGQELPENAGEDSISFLPALLGKAGDAPMRDAVVSRATKGAPMGIRVGDWKYIAAGRGQPAELYNLKEDVSEKKNLHDQHPEVVERLKARMEQIIQAGRSR